MSPEIVVGLFVLVGSLVATIAALIGGILRSRSERVTATTSAAQADLAARFDDASQLAQYIREEVERQVAPIRAELQNVKSESHEMHDAVRARETQLWLWDQRGRAGELPMLPKPILDRLGLIHLIATEVSEDTEPT